MARKKRPIGKCSIRGHRRKFDVLRVLSNPYGSVENRVVFVYLNIQGHERIAPVKCMSFASADVKVAIAKANVALDSFRPRTKNILW